MTGDRDVFSTYAKFNGGDVVFGSDLKGKIIGKGNIAHEKFTFEKVVHVKNLAFNLLSVGKLCDKGLKVIFDESCAEIVKNGEIIITCVRKQGVYTCKLSDYKKLNMCLATIHDTSTLWHRRLGHANMRQLQRLSSMNCVRDLPNLKFDCHFCDACKIGKQVRSSHKPKNLISTKRCLELLHMDLFGPSSIQSYGGNFYTLVVVDDFSRYTWTFS